LFTLAEGKVILFQTTVLALKD